MARDLIPPPSPAGRPLPEGTPRLVESPPEPTPPGGHPEPAAGERAVGPSPFRSRFGFLIGALAGVTVVAVGILVLVLTTGGGGTASDVPNWSAWQPPDQDLSTGAGEIARHVGAGYRLDNGQQLVSVTGSPLEIQSVPLNVAVRVASGDIQLVNGHGVMYTLNGLGPHGSIATGTKSASRHLLLRREALELSLYSFRYLKGVDMVVTLLPPPPPDKTTSATEAANPPLQAVFYRPGDLKPQLQVPLRYTVPPATPRPATIRTDEGRRIDSLTLGNLFTASVQQAQDTKAYLVLTHIAG